MKRILVLLWIASLHLVASPIPDFPFVTVSGDASSDVPPDSSEITFTVLVHGPDAEVATTAVHNTLKGVTQGILSLGVPAGAITADDLSKRAVRQQGENYKQLEILGYDISRDVKVKLADLAHYTAVVRLIMNSPNITSVSSEFDTVKRDDVEAKLIGKACADAKRKATLMSNGAGASLGDVFAISDRDFSSLYDQFGFGYTGSVLSAGVDDDDVPVFVPAKITIHATVEVLYRLRPSQKREQGVVRDPPPAPSSAEPSDE